MTLSPRARNWREQAEDAVEALGQRRSQRQNRSAPVPEPHCPTSRYGRCYFTGAKRFDPASGRDRACCFYCGKFEYVWVQERDAIRAKG